MDIGRLFGHAWGLFVKDIGPLIVGALLAGIVPTIAATFVLILALGATFAIGAISSGGEVAGLTPAGIALLVIGLTLVVVVAVLISAPLLAGLVLGLTRRVREGRPMGYGDAFQGFSVFGQAVGATALVAAVIFFLFFVPVILAVLAAVAASWLFGALAILSGIVAVAAALYLYTRWVYLLPLIVDQGASATGSLRTSGAMVSASGWWQTFLALIVMSLVVGVVSSVLSVIPVVGAVASLLLTPFALTYLVAMYFAARREEALVDAVVRPAPLGNWPSATSWQGGTDTPAMSAPAAPWAPPAAPGQQDDGRAAAPDDSQPAPPGVSVAPAQPPGPDADTAASGEAQPAPPAPDVPEAGPSPSAHQAPP